MNKMKDLGGRGKYTAFIFFQAQKFFFISSLLTFICTIYCGENGSVGVEATSGASRRGVAWFKSKHVWDEVALRESQKKSCYILTHSTTHAYTYTYTCIVFSTILFVWCWNASYTNEQHQVWAATVVPPFITPSLKTK